MCSVSQCSSTNCKNKLIVHAQRINAYAHGCVMILRHQPDFIKFRWPFTLSLFFSISHRYWSSNCIHIHSKMTTNLLLMLSIFQFSLYTRPYIRAIQFLFSLLWTANVLLSCQRTDSKKKMMMLKCATMWNVAIFLKWRCTVLLHVHIRYSSKLIHVHCTMKMLALWIRSYPLLRRLLSLYLICFSIVRWHFVHLLFSLWMSSHIKIIVGSI